MTIEVNLHNIFCFQMQPLNWVVDNITSIQKIRLKNQYYESKYVNQKKEKIATP